MSMSSSVSASYPVSPFQPEFDQQFGWSDPYEQNLTNFYQGEYGKNSQLTSQVVGNQLANAQGSLNDLSSYEGMFGPEEAAMKAQADQYASPAGQKFFAGQAAANEMQAGKTARDNALKDLESYGVNPSSGSFAALDRASQVQAGAAAAAAGTEAAARTRQQGFQMQGQVLGQLTNSQAVNLGYRHEADAANSAAENAQLSNFNSGANAMGTIPGLLGATKYPGIGNAMHSQSQSSGNGNGRSRGNGDSGGYDDGSGSGSGSGSGGGGDRSGFNIFDTSGYAPGGGPPDSGGSDFSDSGGGDTGGGNFGDYNDGGVVGYDDGGPAVNLNRPTTGGHVPYGASPSHGQQTDDVPARLNAGEEVIPRDVAAYHGKKFFIDLIKKARAAMGTDPNQHIGATMKPALHQPPTFRSQAVNLG